MTDKLIANVLTRGRFDIAGPALASAIQERFGDHGVTARVLVPTMPGKTGFILMVGSTPVGVVYEDFAMPFDELKPPDLERRDRVGFLREHRAHAMLGVIADCEGREDTLLASMALLQVASVLTECRGASAVLWSAAQTLTAAEPLRKAVAAATASPDDIPLTIFARFAGYQDGMDGTTPLLGVFGTGFYRFIGRDIELVPKGRPLAEMFNSLGLVASWVMQGLELEDGHSYGRSSQELIRVRYRDQGLVLKRPVLLFDIERLDEAPKPMQH